MFVPMETSTTPVPRRSTLCRLFDLIPSRLNIGVMIFFACFFTYMLRVNISITLLAMVNHYDEYGNLVAQPDYGPRYDWTAYEQSIVLGAYFWGYAITSLPTGVLCEKYGGKNIVTYIFATCVVLTALGPVMAQFPVWVTCFMRFLVGLASGGLYPALHKMLSKWAPPLEKNRFMTSMVGGAIGTVATWPLAGILIETIGWEWGFYVTAMLTAVMALVWYLITYDTPAEHPRISDKEREYIENSLMGVEKVNTWPPLWEILKSVPFWSLFFLHYGNLWGLYFLLTGAPKYMSEILGFNLAQAGILASLPYLTRFIAGYGFGAAIDYIQGKNWWTVTSVRKFMCIFSHIIPGMFLIAMIFIDNQPYVCVTLITLSLGFNGASTTTNLQNSHDLSPNYAATVYSLINTVGTTTGFITPLVVAYFTSVNNTPKEWSIIFGIGAIAYIAPALLFFLFGSGSIQAWNEISSHRQSPESGLAVEESAPTEKKGIKNEAFENRQSPESGLVVDEPASMEEEGSKNEAFETSK